MFSFQNITYEELLRGINSLDTSESIQSKVKIIKIIIKDSAHIFIIFILKNFNQCIKNENMLVLSLKKVIIMTNQLLTVKCFTVALENLRASYL